MGFILLFFKIALIVSIVLVVKQVKRNKENDIPVYNQTQQREDNTASVATPVYTTPTPSHTPLPATPVPVENTPMTLPFTEISKRITEQTKVVFGQDSTWRWCSVSKDRESVRNGGTGDVLVTNENSITEIKVIPENGDVSFLFVDFKPLPKIKENYSLMAFQWFEENYGKVNAIVSSAVKAKLSEAMIPGDILPKKETWDDISKIIVQESEYTASVADNGILVKIGG